MAKKATPIRSESQPRKPKNPGTPVKARQVPEPRGGGDSKARNSATGRFVNKDYADKRKSTKEIERIKPKSRPRKK